MAQSQSRLLASRLRGVPRLGAAPGDETRTRRWRAGGDGWGSEGHTIIQGNLFAAALTKLRGSPCRPFPSDMAVKTGFQKGRYP